MILRQKIIFFPIAEGGVKIVGVFRVKNHDFTPKNHIFSNFRGGGGAPPLLWIRPAIISTSWRWVSIERILVHVCIACADSVFSMPLACCSLISNDRASFSNCSRFISFSLSARRLSRVELQDWIIWDLISSSTLANSQFSASFRSFVWYLYVSILSPGSCFDCLNLYISYSWFLFGMK